MLTFRDLRTYLGKLRDENELMEIEGADWNVEIGTLCELLAEKGGPAILFDKVKEYPPGFRVAANLFTTRRRYAILSGMAPDAKGLEIVQKWRGMEFKPIKPVEVKSGPIMENVHLGENVNLLEFPAPKFHEEDGGRYLGTGHVVIMKDPDTGYINAGVQRVMVHDEKTLGLYISPGKHNLIIRNKYHSKGLSCPVVMGFGPDPILFISAVLHVPWGISEFDWAGWLRGEPIEIIKGEITGLPLPANDEIVIEGECPPLKVESRMEGPFGEWPGYYASGARPEAVVRVKAIYHRNNPIIASSQMMRPPYCTFGVNTFSIAAIWDDLEKAGIPGVKGVWSLEAGGGRFFTVVAIEQQYAGHAKQAGLVAAGGHGGGYFGRFTIVVDDDIDPTDTDQVLWAVATRCDLETSIDIIRGCWGTNLDPRLPPEKREKKDLSHSIAIVNACRPYYWKDQFPMVCAASPLTRKETLEKWKERISLLK